MVAFRLSIEVKGFWADARLLPPDPVGVGVFTDEESLFPSVRTGIADFLARVLHDVVGPMIADLVMMVLNPSSGDSSPQTSCSICLEPVGDHRTRAFSKLRCGHVFHLACIGAEFNARGRMICPNCRNDEEGQWPHASGLNHNHSVSDDFDGIVELDAVPDVDPLQASPTPLDNMMRRVNRDPESFWRQPSQNQDLGGELPNPGARTLRRRHNHPRGLDTTY